jgi:alpha-ketoglutarate-dependent taurine dioxygenase
MHLDYFTSVERHPGVELDARTRAALAAWEEVAEQPDVHLDMQLAPGDVQLVSNHLVVHARTAYADDPAAPRHLLRLWLSLP